LFIVELLAQGQDIAFTFYRTILVETLLKNINGNSLNRFVKTGIEDEGTIS
jgi:hypothetical protein